MAVERKDKEMEEGTVKVSIFIGSHNYSLNAYVYRLNGEDPNVFYPFIEVVLNEDGRRIGIKVGSKKKSRIFRFNQWIRYRKVKKYV